MDWGSIHRDADVLPLQGEERAELSDKALNSLVCLPSNPGSLDAALKV